MIELFFYLLCGHAIADFALQSEAMAKGKNRHFMVNTIPAGQRYTPCWFYWLAAHSLIHGFMVAEIMPSGYAWIYGAVAASLHFVIDFAKCENWTNPHIDQALHLLTIVGLLVHFNYF